MVFVLDNYDSFTYNLVQYLGELGATVEVRRNDEVTIPQIEALAPDRIVVSPGPCTPHEAGISIDLIRHFAGKVPLLGVCLGHQAIGAAFGGQVVRAQTLMHGKTSQVTHDGRTIFRGINSPLTATRYHSLIVQEEDLPPELEVSAWTHDPDQDICHPEGVRRSEGDRERPKDPCISLSAISAARHPSQETLPAKSRKRVIMALRHRNFPVEGVQFHPESVLTSDGKQMIENFLKL